MRGSSFRLALALVATAAFAAGVSAQYSTSFENPPFTLGTINGQDNWVNGSSSGSSQSIIDSFAHTGRQSLAWDNSGSFNSFYSVRRPMDGFNGAIAPATPLNVSAWMFVDPTTGADRLYGLYAMNSSTSTLGGTNLGLTLAGDGAIRAGTTWGATYGTPLATVPSAVGNWVRVLLSYDGTGGGAAVYDDMANLLWSTTFASVTLSNANGAGQWGINLGTDYDGTTARAGRGYHDDLDVRVVPEPASIVALACAALLLRRR